MPDPESPGKPVISGEASSIVDPRRVFPFLAVAVVVAMLGTGMLAPFLPVYVSELGATGIWVGVIVSSFSISRAALMPFFGWLSDRRGRKWLLSIGMGAAGVISFAYLAGNNIPTLILVRLLHGSAAALILPLTVAYMGDIAPKGQEGKWMGYLNTATTIGLGAGPLLGGIIADTLGPPMVFVSLGLLYLLGVSILIPFIPESHHGARHGAPGPSFKGLLKSRRMWGLMAAWAGYEAAFVAFVTFLPLFGRADIRIGALEVGVLIAVTTGVMAVCQLWTGRLADQFSKRMLVIVGVGLNLAAFAVVPIVTEYWHLVALMVVSGIGSALCTPAVSAMVVGEGHRFGMGSANALLSVAISAGVAIGPIAAGAVSDVGGVDAVFYFCGAIGVPALAVFGWLTRGPQKNA